MGVLMGMLIFPLFVEISDLFKKILWGCFYGSSSMSAQRTATVELGFTASLAQQGSLVQDV